MTKFPCRNVPDVGIELRASCMPSGHASDQATRPGWAFCSHTDLSTWNEPAIFYSCHGHALFHVLHANLRLIWCSIYVYRCRKRNSKTWPDKSDFKSVQTDWEQWGHKLFSYSEHCFRSSVTWAYSQTVFLFTALFQKQCDLSIFTNCFLFQKQCDLSIVTNCFLIQSTVLEAVWPEHIHKLFSYSEHCLRSSLTWAYSHPVV